MHILKVAHDINRNAEGDVKGVVAASRTIYQDIVARYIDGRVKTVSGDVWDYAPCPNDGRAQFVTVNKGVCK